MTYSKETEQACQAYRPLLDDGTHADLTVDEILEDVGQIYYILRCDPKDMCFTKDSIIRKYASEKVRDAYLNSKIELKPLMLTLIDHAFDIGKHIEEYAAGRIKREQIPLDDSPESDLIIGLLVRLSRDTYLGSERINWDE